MHTTAHIARVSYMYGQRKYPQYKLQAQARNFFKAISKLHQSQSVPILLPNVSTDVAMGAKIPVQDIHVGIAQYLAIKLEDSGGWLRCSLPASEDAMTRDEDAGEQDATFKLRLTQRQAKNGPPGLHVLTSSRRFGSPAEQTRQAVPQHLL
jgi:hypothetical protein